MKKLLLILAVSLVTAVATNAQEQHSAPGNIAKNNTLVQDHHQRSPDATRNDTKSTQGNHNPHAGQSGPKAPSSDNAKRSGSNWNSSSAAGYYSRRRR